MTQIKLALAAALLLVPSFSNAGDRIEEVSKSDKSVEARPEAVFALPDDKTKTVTFYAIAKLDAATKEKILLAKENKLSEADMAKLIVEGRENAPKIGTKIGTEKIVTAEAREINSTPACFGWRWGWGRGWGYRGCGGWGYGCGGYGGYYGYGSLYYGGYYNPCCGYGYGIGGGYYGMGYGSYSVYTTVGYGGMYYM